MVDDFFIFRSVIKSKMRRELSSSNNIHVVTDDDMQDHATASSQGITSGMFDLFASCCVFNGVSSLYAHT